MLWFSNGNLSLFDFPQVAKNPLASLAALGLAGMTPAAAGGLNPTGKFKWLFIDFLKIAIIHKLVSKKI